MRSMKLSIIELFTRHPDQFNARSEIYRTQNQPLTSMISERNLKNLMKMTSIYV